MFHKITLTDTSTLPQAFDKGNGFYLVKHPVNLNIQDDIHYYNNGFSIVLDSIDKSFLTKDQFEDIVDVEDIKEKEGYVSESFALKMMAISKAYGIWKH